MQREQKMLQFLVGASMGLRQAQGVFSLWAETDPEKCWASHNPPSPQQLSLFRSKPDNTDLFWPWELNLLSMQRLAPCKGRDCIPFLEEGAGIPRTLFAPGLQAHTPPCLLCVPLHQTLSPTECSRKISFYYISANKLITLLSGCDLCYTGEGKNAPGVAVADTNCKSQEKS